jgi:hypothetical protein
MRPHSGTRKEERQARGEEMRPQKEEGPPEQNARTTRSSDRGLLVGKGDTLGIQKGRGTTRTECEDNLDKQQGTPDWGRVVAGRKNETALGIQKGTRTRPR